MAAEHHHHQQAGTGSRRFAVTCGLLRQYMKEQGGRNGVRCLAPAMAPTSLMSGADVVVVGAGGDATEDEEGRTVLQLFPQQAGTLKASQERSTKELERKKAPLTIFYGGRMVVFDDAFPVEKAEELVKAASSRDVVSPPATGQHLCLLDMPVARKASLQRFLAKRKNRLATGGSDPEASVDANKRVKDDDGAPAPCLGVNSVLSLS